MSKNIKKTLKPQDTSKYESLEIRMLKKLGINKPVDQLIFKDVYGSSEPDQNKNE